MDRKKGSAGIPITLVKYPVESVNVGSKFSLAVRIGWPAGMHAGRSTYLVREGETTIQAEALPQCDSDGTVAINLTAPENPGEHSWQLIVSGVRDSDSERVEGSLPFVFSTVPHATSLAVWDVPSPVVRGARLEVNVGGRCSASCCLKGGAIEVFDESGQALGTAAFGGETLPGTMGLYWARVALTAPRRLKLNIWTVRFSPDQLKLAHARTISRFSFTTVAEPEHSVFIKVVNKQTKAPVANAQVRLGIYRAVTNQSGVTRLAVPSGDFPLIVTRAGYEVPERSIRVSKNIRVQIGAQALPEEDPFAIWTA